MIPAIKPFPPLPYDLCGRDVTEDGLIRWVERQPQIIELEAPLRTYLGAVMAEPVSLLPAIRQAIDQDQNPDTLLDPAAMLQNERARACLPALRILLKGYAGVRARIRLEQRKIIDAQVKRDGMEIPALSDAAEALLASLSLQTDNEAVSAIWRAQENRHLVKELKDYGDRVTAKLGASKAATYVTQVQQHVLRYSAEGRGDPVRFFCLSGVEALNRAAVISREVSIFLAFV